jgi:serine/threonine protein kinase
LKEKKAGNKERELCPKCGKAIARERRSGSLTSYLFGGSDCLCSGAGVQGKSHRASDDVLNTARYDNADADNGSFCPKCGLKVVASAKEGSLTGFLLQSTRCKCPPDQAFADGQMSSKFWKLKQAGSGTIFSSTTDEPDRAAARSVDLLPGAIIGGAYKIINLLGRGGMGEVYLARHETLGKKCALKVIPPEQVTEIGWQRFQLEAKAVAKLEHINLVRVTDLGIHEGCLPFYAMDYVEGLNLAELLAQNGPMPIKAMLEIFMQVCDGVECAHRHGILHRDLKPANIMLTNANAGLKMPKVLDFGLAKLTSHDRTKQSLTAVGDLFGSPYYMSPEQCMGHKLDNRSDIYSLGCTMFECLTGRPPFVGNMVAAVVFSQMEGEPPTLESVVGPSVVPDAMEIVMAKLLRKNPVERYQTLPELRGDLERVLRGESVAPFYVSRGQQPHRQNTGVSSDGGWQPQSTQSRSGFPVAAAMAVGAVTIVALVAEMALWSKAKPQPKSQQAGTMPTKVLTAKPGALLKISPYLQNPNASSGELRQFVFPRDRSLGRMKLFSLTSGTTSSSTEPMIQAQGLVSVPRQASLALYPGRNVESNPELLGGFGPDDLDSLTLGDEEDWSDRHMAYVGSLTGLRKLDIGRAAVTDKCIADINKLQKLRRLFAQDTLLTGFGLAQLKRLPFLQSLALSHSQTASIAVRRLINSKTLEFVSVPACNLDDSCMRVFGTMPNLHSLGVKDNPSITDHGLGAISHVPHLASLDISGTGVTGACIDQLAAFPALKTLYLDDVKWNEADKIRLRRSISAGTIIVRPERTEWSPVLEPTTP